MARFTILVVDDEKTLARSIKLFLGEHGYEAEVAEDGDVALDLLEKLHPDLVFLDLRLPKTTGLELLRKIRQYDPYIAVVMLTAYGTIEGAVEAMKLGALDYLKKPIDLDELKIVVERAEEASRIRQEVQYYREREARDFEFEGLVGRCPAMQRIFGQIKHLASLEEEAPTVLLTGETGTGKSLVARALHVQSRRASHPFIEIDCTSLPPTLIETELFGYEKGSFTDARESKVGLIEAADGGTVFLDEVGDLGLSLQGKLLRVIEARTVRRIGSVRDRRVNAWLLAATNKDLTAAMTAGAFRKDLYYRLDVLTIHLPPLRERGEDIPLLAEIFLKRFRTKYGKRVARLGEGALAALRAYAWPGNVRELKHVIERAVLGWTGGDEVADVSLGPPATTPGPDPAPPRAGSPFLPTGHSLAEWERAMIERALQEAGGNQARAARLLGISRDTLRYRMAKFKLPR
jgi:two-component system, NtrC family, response regulator AtoC